MAGPWEKYQNTVPQGPWTKYADSSAPTPYVDTSHVAGAGALGVPQIPAQPNQPNMRGGAGNLDVIPSSQSEPGVTGAIKTGVHNFGARIANNGIALVKPMLHPVDSVLSYGGFENPADQGGPIQTIIHSPDKGVGVANALGDTASALLLGKATQGAAEGLSSVAPKIVPAVGKVGQAAQDLAAGIRNSKFAPTMKEVIRGNNPGRGTLEAGIGTTFSKGSMARKVDGAMEAVGNRIGDAVLRADQNELAPPILSRSIAPLITSPISDALGTLNGPFGTAPTAPYETMSAKLGNTAPGASAPIYGPNAPTEIAPSDLWKTIQNLDKNTRFNTDPEVESVNETRRDIRHGLRPVLEATDPAISPLSRTYSDLLSADNAISRSQGGFSVPKGFASVLDSTIKSTPVVTGTSSGLFKLGRGLKSFATNAPEWMGGTGGSPATLPFTQRQNPTMKTNLLDSGTISNPGGDDFSAGGFPNRPSVITPQPSSLFRLPASVESGEVQPMIGIRNDYPKLAVPFARERVPATLFKDPTAISNGMFSVGEDGQIVPNRLALPAPQSKLTTRLKKP